MKLSKKLLLVIFLTFITGFVLGGIVHRQSNRSHTLIAAKLFVRNSISDLIYGNPYDTYGYPTKKIYTHRCDSVEKVKEQIGKVIGVELDITFYPEQGIFDTSHDPQPSIRFPLEDFFIELSKTDFKFWLDFKNLTPDNALQALNELNRLFSKYNIDKKRAIVESHNYNNLDIFRNNGFYTSFYCPVNDQRYLQTDDYFEEYKTQLINAVNSGNVNAVSFPANYYSLVKKSGVDVDLLTWHLGMNFSRHSLRYYIRDNLVKTLMNDDKVKVILAPRSSAFDR